MLTRIQGQAQKVWEIAAINSPEACQLLIKRFSELTSKTYYHHDNHCFEDLERTSAEFLQLLRVSEDASEEGGKLVSIMYELSDEADMHLIQRNRDLHDLLFSKISDDAKRLDRVIGLKRGSIADEIRWWRHFRLAFDKNSFTVVRWYHMLAAYYAVFREHYRRLGSFTYALRCTSELGRAGLAHKVRDREKERFHLERYYAVKLKGNRNRIEPELYSM